jgi:hypothetical protein
MRPDRIRAGVVGVSYRGSRHVCVLRSTAGVAAVVGVDQRFAQIDDGQQQTDQGVVVYAGLGDVTIQPELCYGGAVAAEGQWPVASGQW